MDSKADPLPVVCFTCKRVHGELMRFGGTGASVFFQTTGSYVRSTHLLAFGKVCFKAVLMDTSSQPALEADVRESVPLQDREEGLVVDAPVGVSPVDVCHCQSRSLVLSIADAPDQLLYLSSRAPDRPPSLLSLSKTQQLKKFSPSPSP
eukprot:3940712-Rhodomonas_salina.2